MYCIFTRNSNNCNSSSTRWCRQCNNCIVINHFAKIQKAPSSKEHLKKYITFAFLKIIMEIYKILQSKYELELQIIKKNHNLISLFRMICILLFLIFGYYFFKTENSIFLYLSLFSFSVFLILIRFHNKLSHQKELKEAIIMIKIVEFYSVFEVIFLSIQKRNFIFIDRNYGFFKFFLMT